MDKIYWKPSTKNHLWELWNETASNSGYRKQNNNKVLSLESFSRISLYDAYVYSTYSYSAIHPRNIASGIYDASG